MTFREALIAWNGGVERGAPARLARTLKVSPAIVSEWIRGKPPGELMQQKICRIMALEASAVIAMFRPRASGFMLREPQAPYQESSPEVHGQTPAWTVPVLGIVSATGLNISETDPYPELIAVPFQCKRCFAIRVSGDCMEPTFRDGEYVVVDPDASMASGKIALVMVDGEYTLKRCFPVGDIIELKPDNPKHKTLRLAAKVVTIRGVVRWSCRKH